MGHQGCVFPLAPRGTPVTGKRAVTTARQPETKVPKLGQRAQNTTLSAYVKHNDQAHTQKGRERGPDNTQD